MPTPIEWLAAFQANPTETGSQLDPHIIGLSNGNILVAWTEDQNNAVASSTGFDIVGRILDARGNVVREEFQINTTRAVDDERDFDIAAMNDGGFIMVFVDDDISNSDQTSIIWERYNSSGNAIASGNLASETSATENLSNPQVAVDLTDNSSVVTFTRTTNGDDNIRAVAIAENGSESAEFDAAQNGSDFDRDGDVATLTNGNFVSVYEEDDGGTTSIEFEVFNASGVTVAGPTNIGAGARVDPHVTGLSDGNFVVTWTQTDTGSGNIGAEVRSPTGSIVRSQFTVAGTTDSENEPAVVALPQGGFVVFWDNDTDDTIKARAYFNNGTPDGDVVTVATAGTVLEIGTTADGRVLFTWMEDFILGDIFAAIWDPRGSTIEAADYNQTLTNFVNNTGPILGTEFVDTLTGDLSDNTFEGLAAGDHIDGGGGTDTAAYSQSGSAVTVQLNNGTGTGGDAQGDVLSNIENLVGSDHNDTLIGSTFVNTLNGGDGDDFLNASNGDDTLLGGNGDDDLVGGAGADILDGGSNTAVGDTATYSNSNDAVTISLAGGDGFGGHAAGDQLIGIENLFGSVFADTLVGDFGNNTINGFNGNDYIDGNLGNDTLLGGNGDDTFNSSTGADFINGGTGNDTIDYSGSSAGVTVQINNGGTVTGGHATGDTLIVENIIGSEFADDIIGSTLANILTGNGDDDLFNGSSGNDTINGGSGDDFILGSRGGDTIDGGSNTTVGDTASYSNSDARVVVDLAAGTATGSGHGSGDTLIDIENIFGSAFNDDIFGDANDNRLEGFNGVDELFGRGGNDVLIGGGGFDFLNGGEGDDILLGSGGTDRFLYDIANFGADSINDFTNNLDLMDFRGSGLQFSDLTVTVGAMDTVITVTADPTNSITLLAVTSLINEDDFIF